ncbi:MAG: Hsp20/alpha crystallin family protein [Microthrixaceae bacterium]
MLMRFDPFRELDRLTQPAWPGTRPAVMPMDAFREGDRFTVRLDVPGIDPDTIELTVEQNVLTIAVERKWTRGDDLEVVVAERPQGSFSRQLFLGEGLDADRIAATYDNGVLTVSIPVAEQAKPRRVEVQQGPATSRAIETSATETASSAA